MILRRGVLANTCFWARMLCRVLCMGRITGSVLLLLICAGCTRTRQPSPPAGSLEASAAISNSRGETKGTIRIFGPGEVPPFDLDRMLRTYTVLIATPSESKVATTTEYILTWYRFKALDVISTPPHCLQCDNLPPPPTDFQAAQNEFVLPIVAGTATINGVELTMVSDEPRFELNQRYLLFVDMSGGRVAQLGGGWAGAYQVSQNGTLSTRIPRSARLKDEILAEGTIGKLRTRAKLLLRNPKATAGMGLRPKAW